MVAAVVAAGFLHGGLLHILMNGWVLWIWGQVELVYGPARLIALLRGDDGGRIPVELPGGPGDFHRGFGGSVRLYRRDDCAGGGESQFGGQDDSGDLYPVGDLWSGLRVDSDVPCG